MDRDGDEGKGWDNLETPEQAFWRKCDYIRLGNFLHAAEVYLGSSPSQVHMKALVKRWGGSLVIRLDPQESRRLGLQEDMEVEVDIQLAPIGFDDLPTVHGGGGDAKRHDELLHARR